MIRYSENEPYDSGDVVCVALIPIGQVVSWAPGTYEPERAIWIPQGAFERIGAVAQRLRFPVFGELVHEQNRLSASACEALLERWDDMEEETKGTPAAPWAAQIRVILRDCLAVPNRSEVLIEWP